MRLVLTAVVALALVPATAAATPAHGPPSHAQAVAALDRATKLSKGEGVRTGRELSLALAQLAAALPALSGDERQRAESLLARPDDSTADPQGTHKWSVPEDPSSPMCTTHFCVHWVKVSQDAPDQTDTDGDKFPNYVEAMAATFENEVYPCENGTAPAGCAGANGPGLGWREAADDSPLGGGPDGGRQLDVYIENLFPDGIFGYVAIDPGQTQDPSVPHTAYMVLDKDYDRFATPTTTGMQAMQVTAAHEYNHVLQNAYDFLEDAWMFEATAVWMEEKVYPAVDDYLQYMGAWISGRRQPLTLFQGLKPYGSAVWNHFLDARHGSGTVRAAWEGSVAAGDFAPGAYQAAIAANGGAGFADELARFSAAVAEWRVPGSGFPDRYPDVPRDGTLPVGSATSPFALAHTTFALFDVPVPADAPPTIRLTATLPAGIGGAVALVGRTGADPDAGAVTSNLAAIPSGGRGAVGLDNPAAFGRITAVVANTDVTRSGFNAATGDWNFTHDANGVTAALEGPGPPVATTGAAAGIADHSASVTGSVDPRLLDTTWRFEYGKTSGYGSATAVRSLPASSPGAGPVQAALANLAPNTLYHFRVVAANSAGPAAGQDMVFRTAVDATPPKLDLRASRRQRSVKRRGILFAARCSERCRGVARLELTRALAKRLRVPRVIGTARVSLPAGTSFRSLEVKLSRKARARVRRNKAFKVTLRVTVADSSRNRAVRSKRIVARS